MTQTIRKVWLYSDSHASMDTAAATALKVAKHHDASLTILNVVESGDPILKTSAGRELLQLIRDDKDEGLRCLEGFFIGSVAETILSRLKSSALVVKPSHFVSPVRVN